MKTEIPQALKISPEEAYSLGFKTGRDTIMQELVKMHQNSIKPVTVVYKLCESCNKAML